MARARLLVAVVLLAGCGDEELLHGLDEGQANQVLVALGEARVPARKQREDGSEGGWVVAVPPAESPRARQILAERELPRARPPGFAEVFGKGSMVPTATEERALFLHALAGELSRSIEALDGVVEARVHLALPAPDPLRPEAQRAPRAAVLVKCRPAALVRIEGLAPGIRSLVAGAAEALEPANVSVIVAEAAAAPAIPEAPRRGPPRLLLVAAALAACAGVGLVAVAVRARPRAGAPGRERSG